jgi:hypothetical protein
MTVVFPKNNLPEPAQPWAREVQKQLANVIASDRANEINNAARDNQLNSSLISLTKVVSDVKIASDKSTEALDGLLGLGSTGSTYTINASNINAGTISGNFISGGTITGTNLQTATSGRRVFISGTTAIFYDESGERTGTITVSGSANESIMQINGPFASRSISFSSSNTFIAGGGGTYIDLSDAPVINMNGNVSVTGRVTTSAGLQSLFSFNNQVGSGARDLFITSAGNLGTTLSSIRIKEDIENLNLPVDAIFSIQPKSFKFKVDIEEFGKENAPISVGFIAEEMHEAGLTDFVYYDKDGQVDGISYTRYVVALQAAVKNLNDRITAIENGA